MSEDKKKEQYIGLRLDWHLYSALTNHLIETGVSASNYIRELIENDLSDKNRHKYLAEVHKARMEYHQRCILNHDQALTEKQQREIEEKRERQISDLSEKLRYGEIRIADIPEDIKEDVCRRAL